VPIYEYRCNQCGHQFERTQRMSEEPVRECEICGGEVARVLFAPAIHFKGTGFHNTDYGSKRRGSKDGEGGASGDGPASEGSSGSDSSPAKEATPKETAARTAGP
jgi:putative FmdB family regulatory protein